MARPIPLELPPRDPREELRNRLENAPVEHAEALLDSYELLQQLHDRGVFAAIAWRVGSERQDS
jgi:beta-phosphoglucomutase-like phosphatase (HAD superfamily)